MSRPSPFGVSPGQNNVRVAFPKSIYFPKQTLPRVKLRVEINFNVTHRKLYCSDEFVRVSIETSENCLHNCDAITVDFNTYFGEFFWNSARWLILEI